MKLRWELQDKTADRVGGKRGSAYYVFKFARDVSVIAIAGVGTSLKTPFWEFGRRRCFRAFSFRVVLFRPLGELPILFVG